MGIIKRILLLQIVLVLVLCCHRIRCEEVSSISNKASVKDEAQNNNSNNNNSNNNNSNNNNSNNNNSNNNNNSGLSVKSENFKMIIKPEGEEQSTLNSLSVEHKIDTPQIEELRKKEETKDKKIYEQGNNLESKKENITNTLEKVVQEDNNNNTQGTITKEMSSSTTNTNNNNNNNNNNDNNNIYLAHNNDLDTNIIPQTNFIENTAQNVQNQNEKKENNSASGNTSKSSNSQNLGNSKEVEQAVVKEITPKEETSNGQNKDKENKDKENKDKENKDNENKDKENKDKENKDKENKDKEKISPNVQNDATNKKGISDNAKGISDNAKGISDNTKDISENTKSLSDNMNSSNDFNTPNNINEDSKASTEYVDLASQKIYDEMNKNVEESGSNLYFLKLLSIGSSIFMQLIFLPTIFKIIKKKTTGELDGFPYIILLLSSFLWLVYGMLLNNSAIVFPNLVGFILGILYCVIYHKNCKNMWLKQKLNSYYKICGFICFLLYAFLYILSYEQYEVFVGFVAFISSIVNFGAPLSYIQIVIKKKNSSLIPMEVTMGSLLCSFLWLTYGFTLKDGFIIIPNLCGFILSLLQVLLIILYSNKENITFNNDSDTTVSEISTRKNRNKYIPDTNSNMFFNEYNVDEENRMSEISTTMPNTIFDLSFDETSPLTGTFNLDCNRPGVSNQKYLKRSESLEKNAAITF